jgi:hypothetical protein
MKCNKDVVDVYVCPKLCAVGHILKMFSETSLFCLYTVLITCYFSHGATAHSGSSSPYYRGFTNTLRHTTVVRTLLDE